MKYIELEKLQNNKTCFNKLVPRGLHEDGTIQWKETGPGFIRATYRPVPNMKVQLYT